MILQKISLICWFAAQETSIIIINVENGLIFFLETFHESLMNRKLKEQHLFEI